MDIGEFCQGILDILTKLGPEKLKHIAILHVLQHNRRVEVVVLAGIDCTVQMCGQDGPAPYLDLLFARQKHLDGSLR